MWQVIFPRSSLERHQHRLFNNILFTTHYKSITSNFITLECKDAISNKLSQRHTLINKQKPIIIIRRITTVCVACHKTKYSTKVFCIQTPQQMNPHKTYFSLYAIQFCYAFSATVLILNTMNECFNCGRNFDNGVFV